jgi:hypothetical protein
MYLRKLLVKSEEFSVIGRVGAARVWALSSAVAIGGASFIGLAAGTAAADPTCGDLHLIGAAGSGERVDPTADAGMGRVVYRSLNDLAQYVQADGRTITAEAVEYPAVEVPLAEGGVGEWMGFMGSVDLGTDALAEQYEAFVERCPTTMVVLAGYSQGAMVVHRNLEDLADSPNLAAALLIADGDRLPEDLTLNLGSAASIPGAGKGVAQDWPILADAPDPLPIEIASRTISVCELGDAVCDYDPAVEEVSPSAVAIHTNYATAPSGFPWTAPLYQLAKMATPPMADAPTIDAPMPDAPLDVPVDQPAPLPA